jgi:hypothetical protein
MVGQLGGSPALPVIVSTTAADDGGLTSNIEGIAEGNGDIACFGTDFIELLASQGCPSSSSPPLGIGGTDVPLMCNGICWHESQCGSMQNPSDCESSCESQGLVRAEWRGDFTSDLEGCFANSSCSNVNGTAFSDCMNKALLQISPTAADQAFCSALAAAEPACGATTFSEQDCLNRTSIFSDPSLSTAKACTTESCSNAAACVSATLPGYSP